MRRPLRLVTLGMAISAVATVQPFRLIVVDGDSMSPTYKRGEIEFASSANATYHRGDVVVFKHDGEMLVKRVVFVPGDRIAEFYNNGDWVTPANSLVLAAELKHHFPRRDLVMGPNQLFVVGDNFRVSVDSRTFGPINTSDVTGKLLTQRPALEPMYLLTSQSVDEFAVQLAHGRIDLAAMRSPARTWEALEEYSRTMQSQE